MIWWLEKCKVAKKPVTTLDDLLDAIGLLRKELKMDFTSLNTAIINLAADVAKEVDDAKNAILAAQAGDPAALDAAVAALNNIDAAVKAADASFTPTGTSTVPPPPVV